MKILHVITSLRKSAGTTTFVNGLCNATADAGHAVTIAIVSLDGECLGEPPKATVKVTTITNVIKANERFGIVHLHGMWELPILRASWWARRHAMPIVWSPHGALSPWAMKHHWWKKVLVWHCFQRSALRDAEILHSTSTRESAWIRFRGFKQPIVEVPLGTKVPCDPQTSGISGGHEHILLFVGRIHPVKGLSNLIKAWMIVARDRPLVSRGWGLRIVGPNQAGYQACLMAEVKSLGIESSVEFAGPKFGDELSKEYENCDCLVLPSFTENFGATVVDALAHGKPCIASTFTPWRELEDRGCGWWVSNEPESLAAAIHEMTVLSDSERHAMGERGRKLVEEKYTWEAVVKTMIEGYTEVLNART